MVLQVLKANLDCTMPLKVCYVNGSFDANIINQEQKDKINTNDTRCFNMIRLTMSMSTNER